MKLKDVLQILSISLDKLLTLHPEVVVISNIVVELKEKDVPYYHVEIPMRVDLPADYLLLYGAERIEPHIGMDLYLPNEQGCIDTISSTFWGTHEALGKMMVEYYWFILDDEDEP